MSITLEEVNSSLISRMGYDPETQAAQVEFKSNRSVYEYRPVTIDEWNEWRMASSIGSWFIHNVKKNPKYTYRRIS